MRELAKQCLSCKNPFCEKGCPLHNHIRDFIACVKNEEFLKAREIIDIENPFPYICSRVCAFEKQCVGNCIKNRMGKPVPVYMIERELSEIELTYTKKAMRETKIAIIGGGIVGLVAAKLLLIEGFEVHLFEKENYLGGTMISGIPAYRLDRKYVDRAIKEVIDLGLNVHYNISMPEDIDIAKLKADGFDKIILGLGAMGSNMMGIENEEYAVDGLKLLYDLNVLNDVDKYRVYKNAVVVGGGNVAMDCARSLAHHLEHVTIIYRRSINEMPANKVEIDEACEEGVSLFELHNPTRVLVEDNCVKGIEAVTMQLGEKDESGRASFSAIKGSETNYDFDLVVMAIGQKVLAKIDDNLELDRRGRVIINEQYETSIKDVYSAGDCVIGPSSISHAIQSAKEMVNAILESLSR